MKQFNRSHILRLLFILLMILMIPPAVSADPGDIGDVCDGDWCDGGVCVNGRCEACGWPGFRCCPGSVCYFESSGYRCNGLGYCINPDVEYDCGQVGWPQCSYAPDFCYTGFPFNGMCISCGDYYQPCCPNTIPEYECDYGECVNGICQPKTSSSGGSGSGGSTTPPGSGGTTSGGSGSGGATTPPGSSSCSSDNGTESCFILTAME